MVLTALAAAALKAAVGALTDGTGGALGELANSVIDALTGKRSSAEADVVGEVTQWGRGRQLGDAALEHGFRLAKEVLDSHGLSLEQAAQLNFDPRRVTNTVLQAAGSRYAERGDDSLREVCRQVLLVSYTRMFEDPTIRELRISAATYELLQRIESPQERHRSAVLAYTIQLRQDLRDYLQSVVDNFSADNWQFLRAGGQPVDVVSLERTLSVMTPGAEPDRVVNADALIDSVQRLVVLGGPGAGKTWFARRVARRVAARALKNLAAGAGLDEVEIPLLVTCEEFRTTPGDRWDAAITPALARCPPRNGAAPQRLAQFLRERDTNVLLVLDSLDEATSTSTSTTMPRDVQQALIGSWRAVITTRPEAWLQQWATTPLSSDPAHSTTPAGAVQATLCALSFPDDVRDFAAAWFTSAGGHATAGTTEDQTERFLTDLGANPAARSLCTVPLFLTFLCLLAPDRELPRTRTGLLDEVVNRTLDTDWRHRHHDHAYDTDLIAIAPRWAWDSTHDDPISGLSTWGPDEVPTGPRPPDIPATAFSLLDGLLPPQGPSGRTVTRGFVHRVVREHLVAGYVAHLPVRAAADILLTHWWFDATWTLIIPTAIVKHPNRDALLTQLKDSVAVPATRAVREILDAVSARTMLQVCVESQPADWAPAAERALHDFRRRHATAEPYLVTQSAHWHQSNAAAAQTVITCLPTVGYSAGVVQGLVALATSEATRAAAVQALITYLPTAYFETVAVVQGLVALDPSEATRATAVQALITYLPTARSQTVEVVQALRVLRGSRDWILRLSRGGRRKPGRGHK